MTRVTAADILKVVPITRKTLWLWQKKYKFFPDPVKEAHPGGKGIVGYYPAWVEERCKKVYALQKKGLHHQHDPGKFSSRKKKISRLEKF